MNPCVVTSLGESLDQSSEGIRKYTAPNFLRVYLEYTAPLVDVRARDRGMNGDGLGNKMRYSTWIISSES